MDPRHRLTEAHLAAQAALVASLPSEVLELTRSLTPAEALRELLAGLPALPNPEVVMLGDYQLGLAVCRQHAHRLVLQAWLAAVARPETSSVDAPQHG